VNWFLTDKLETELGDGWIYLWGLGSFSIFHWWTMSFGALYDWGWFFISPFINPGDSGSYGGEVVPIDKVSLITPYVALTLMACVGFVVVGRKFGKRKRN
jgi:hypothetical protein